MLFVVIGICFMTAHHVWHIYTHLLIADPPLPLDCSRLVRSLDSLSYLALVVALVRILDRLVWCDPVQEKPAALFEHVRVGREVLENADGLRIWMHSRL